MAYSHSLIESAFLGERSPIVRNFREALAGQENTTPPLREDSPAVSIITAPESVMIEIDHRLNTSELEGPAWFDYESSRCIEEVVRQSNEPPNHPRGPAVVSLRTSSPLLDFMDA